MMISFFKHGIGPSRPAINYLLSGEVQAYDKERNRINGKMEIRDPLPEVLSGNPDHTGLLIDGIHRKWGYTSGVIAFAAEDDPSLDEQNSIMREFEEAAFAGLDHDQYDILWVKHNHKSNVELHFLVPMIELHSGKALNVAPPGHAKYFNAFRDFWNAEKGWASPNDPERARMTKSKFESLNRKEARAMIDEFIIGRIESGQIENHADVREALAELDFLEFKALSPTKINKRIKADEIEASGGPRRNRDTKITMIEKGQSGPQHTYKLEGRIYLEDWTAAEYFAAENAREVEPRSREERKADRGTARKLHLLLERAIERRKAKNRERYGRVQQGVYELQWPEPLRAQGVAEGAQGNVGDDPRRDTSDEDRGSLDGDCRDDVRSASELPSNHAHDVGADPREDQSAAHPVVDAREREASGREADPWSWWPWRRDQAARRYRSRQMQHARWQQPVLNQSKTGGKLNDRVFDQTRERAIKRAREITSAINEKRASHQRTREWISEAFERTRSLATIIQEARSFMEPRVRGAFDKIGGAFERIRTKIGIVVERK